MNTYLHKAIIKYCFRCHEIEIQFQYICKFTWSKGEELRKGRKRCKEEERWKQKNDRDGRDEGECEGVVEGDDEVDCDGEKDGVILGWSD